MIGASTEAAPRSRHKSSQTIDISGRVVEASKTTAISTSRSGAGSPIWQRDWVARADWCVQSYEEANYPPVVIVNGESGLDIVRMAAQPGEIVEVDASGTSNPDGDDLEYYWWNYREAEQIRGDSPAVEISDPQSERAAIEIPHDAEEWEYHVVSW